MATATHQQVRNELDTVEIFQTSVYGNIDEHHFDFPLPINREEAGPSAVMTTDGSRVQRRNLWIDSFGILNYVSLAMGYKQLGDHQKTQRSLRSAEALISSVFEVLGTPRSFEFPMALSFSLEGGFKGLRNGSVNARLGDSDVGMEFDGMSLHCVDKFLFALCRYAHCLDDHSAKANIVSKAVKVIKDIHPHFLVPHVGYMSKVNTDMSPIPTLLSAISPSHDTVKAFVVYKIVEAEGGDVASEIADLFPLVMTYLTRHPSDLLLETYESLNLGSHLWTLQFLDPVFLSPSPFSSSFADSSEVVKEWEPNNAYEHAISISQHPLVENTLYRYADEVQAQAKSVLKGEMDQLLGTAPSTLVTTTEKQQPQSQPQQLQAAPAMPSTSRVLFGLLGAEMVVSLWHPAEETKKKTTPSSCLPLLPPPLGTLAAPSSPPHSALSSPFRDSTGATAGGTSGDSSTAMATHTPLATEEHDDTTTPLATYPHADLYMFARDSIESMASKQLRSLQRKPATASSSVAHPPPIAETKNATDLVAMSAALLPSAWKSLPHERFVSIYSMK